MLVVQVEPEYMVVSLGLKVAVRVVVPALRMVPAVWEKVKVPAMPEDSTGPPLSFSKREDDKAVPYVIAAGAAQLHEVLILAGFVGGLHESGTVDIEVHAAPLAVAGHIVTGTPPHEQYPA